MKLERFIKLDKEYVGFIADIGKECEIQEQGIAIIVIDFFKIIDDTNLNILPCKVLIAPTYYFDWLIKNKYVVVKRYNFIND